MPMRILGSKPALWPTLFTAPALIVLIGLGSWQMQRWQWKSELIRSVETGLAAAPVLLPAAVDDPGPLAWRKVTVAGRFRHDREIHLLARDRFGRLGYQVATPLERPGGGHVLVLRGWVPNDRKEPASRADGQVTGPVTVTGIVRLPWRPGWFTPDNDPAKNVWFWPDRDAMQRFAGVDFPALLVEADATPIPGGLPQGGQTRVDIPNDHLHYALTWYGFAIALAVIYVLWHRQRAGGNGA